MRTETTAIIVNDRGEVFVGWRSACSISGNGWEDYYTVPEFGVPSTYQVKPGDFVMFDQKPGDIRYVNRPYVFSSIRAAEKSKSRIYGHGKLAVVS